MKNLPIILSAFIFLIFISCGSENVTNQNPGTGEEVIFSMDSFAINLENSLAVKDTNILISNAPNIKISFDCLTNADSVNSLALIRIVAGDSSTYFFDSTLNYISLLNNAHVMYLTGSNFFYIKIFIQISRSNTSPYYIRMKNLRGFRV